MSLNENHFLLPNSSICQNGENGKNGDPLLKAWGEQLERWCAAAGWSQRTVAYYADVKERTVRDWVAGRAVPQAKKLGNLIVALYDAKHADPAAMDLENNSLSGRSGHIWRQPLDVFDWLALLGMDAFVVLKLSTNEAVKKWLSTALNNASWPHTPMPTMYVERELSQEIVTALLRRRGYRQPFYRVVVLYGPPGSGKSTLSAAVMRQPILRTFFRSGGQWLPSEEMKWLLGNNHRLLGDGVNNSWDQWWHWLASETTLGLVAVDDLTDPELLNELLGRAVNSQIQFIITTQDRDKVQAGLGCLAANEVLYLGVGGFDQAQAESFLHKLWGRPLSEVDREYLSRILGHLNRPESLRLLAGEVAAVGWKEVWQWLWEGQDQNTPLGNHWHRLLSKAWSRCEPTEHTWLGQIAAAVQRGSTFGSSFAASAWSIKPDASSQRLILLERRGWLEQVDEITPDSAPNLVILLGRKRYRLLREGWTFIQKESRITVGLKDRLVWAGQLARQWQKQLGISWWQLGGSIWKRWKKSGGSLDSEGGYKYEDHRLERWLVLNWIRYGIWPPEELWLIYEASTRSRWGLLPLRLMPGLIIGLSFLALSPVIAIPSFLAAPSLLHVAGGSYLLDFLGHAVIVDLPYHLVTGNSPALPVPEQAPALLSGQLLSKEDDTAPLVIDIDNHYL